MNFDLYNRPLKIWKSIGTSTLKVGAIGNVGVQQIQRDNV
jgi:hypothetical protein